jgi:hypothetical protein
MTYDPDMTNLPQEVLEELYEAKFNVNYSCPCECHPRRYRLLPRVQYDLTDHCPKCEEMSHNMFTVNSSNPFIRAIHRREKAKWEDQR